MSQSNDPKQGDVIQAPALAQRLNEIFLAPTTDVANDEFFDNLMMRSEPLPWMAPAYENAAGIPIFHHEIDSGLSFRPDPRDLIASNISLCAEVPLRFVRILQSHNRVHRVFSLPYGTPSDFEKRMGRQDPLAIAMKEAFLLLHGEIAATRQAIEGQLASLKKEQDQAAQQLRQLRQQVASAEINQRRRLTAASWRADPLFVALSIPTESIPFQFVRHYSELFWHLVAWGNYPSTQAQQAWMRRAKELANNLCHQVSHGNLKEVLTPGEIGQFVAWTRISIANPGAWMMGFNPDKPDALMIRGR